MSRLVFNGLQVDIPDEVVAVVKRLNMAGRSADAVVMAGDLLNDLLALPVAPAPVEALADPEVWVKTQLEAKGWDFSKVPPPAA